MKRLFILLIGFMLVGLTQAQVLQDNESALVYYSPKTLVRLDFTYTVEHFERGQYAEFAESLLGASDAVKETGSVCTLQEVKIGTTTTTDFERPHKVSTDAGFPVLLTINDKGLLTGYNVRSFGSKPAPKHDKECEKENKPKKPRTLVAPYPESVLKAANPSAQAHEIAKQIFHLRETRMYLLNGEVENAPADGEAMRLVLEDLDKQERELTHLFVGKRFKRVEHKSVLVEPNDAGELLFFSEENGFTQSDNIDADTIKVRMICEPTIRSLVVDPKAKKKGVELSQIVYNIPGHCTVEVLYKGQKMASRAVPVAQLGVDVALPKSMFTGKDLPKIVFSEKTGNIESINQ